MSDPRLSLGGVSKSFGGVLAVDRVSLEVGPGEIVGLVGPNGAGKTTLFNCVTGQLEPDAGTVVFAGIELGGMATFRRARLGIGRTYQRVEVFPELTVGDHLLVAERGRTNEGRLWRDLLGRGGITRAEKDRIDAVLDQVGLSDRVDTPVAALGLGPCRLVELARALVAEPRLLMADEPSSGLDSRERGELAAVLRALQKERGMAVLVVEHDLAMVDQLVDRCVVMDLGRVIASGPFASVMSDAGVRRAYLGVEA